MRLMRSALQTGVVASTQPEPGEQRVVVLDEQPGAALAQRFRRHVVGTVDRLAVVEVQRLVHVPVERVVRGGREQRAVVPSVVVERRVETKRWSAVLLPGLVTRADRSTSGR